MPDSDKTIRLFSVSKIRLNLSLLYLASLIETSFKPNLNPYIIHIFTNCWTLKSALPKRNMHECSLEDKILFLFIIFAGIPNWKLGRVSNENNFYPTLKVISLEMLKSIDMDAAEGLKINQFPKKDTWHPRH